MVVLQVLDRVAFGSEKERSLHQHFLMRRRLAHKFTHCCSNSVELIKAIFMFASRPFLELPRALAVNPDFFP
ncbi:hypothetical protein HUU05_00070 [candidate division KSB1 bacterium]|nr:hypothetical protein [candidate division KSB1 bacterium]